MKYPYLLIFLILTSCQLRSCGPSPFYDRVERSSHSKNVLLIGWDGVRRDLLLDYLKQNKLPHLQSVLSQGSFVETRSLLDTTHTKPGWSQILTGYDSKKTGVYSSLDYEPIPKGLTIFERLKERYGKNIYTFFISGSDADLGSNGPHKICITCTKLSLKKDEIYEERKGEPYFNALAAIDYYKNSLGKWENVTTETAKLIKTLNGRQFFGFIHFTEPDAQGHTHGGDSPEYRQALLAVDHALGTLIQQLKDLDLARNTAFFVTTDHGFTHGFPSKPWLNHTHNDERQAFLVSSLKKLKAKGEFRDLTPTVLDLYDFDLTKIEPKIEGQSLIRK